MRLYFLRGQHLSKGSATATSSMAMTIPVIVIQSLIWALVKCSGEGNIRLLEEEVLAAMKACVLPNDSKENSANQRQRRSEDYTRIDSNDNPGQNRYSHERRNSSDMRDQMHILNATDYDYWGYGSGGNGEKFVSSAPKQATGGGGVYNKSNLNRTRRSDALMKQQDNDQCLSQCIFANLQVVDTRGIPRETEFWNKVQSSVTSQQSRAALRDQTRVCFQELQSEAEDNGCSYSNKLERCLMLRFADRKLEGSQNRNNQKN